MLVIALDSPTNPTTATDALFATNNFNAGVLIGKYARAATKGKTVTIAMLDEHAGSSVGKLRHDGFLKGFGIKGSNKRSSASGTGRARSRPRRRRWRTASRRTRHRRRLHDQRAERRGRMDRAAGAGKEDDVTIVSVDGGCAGVRNVKAGMIDATSQQYPLLMARWASRRS